MDTQGTTAHLDAVAHEVVGHSPHLLRLAVEQRYIVGVGHGEGMVCGHESLFLVAPFEEGEIDDPQTFELILVAQSQPVAHLQTEGAQLYACLVGIVAGEDEHEVAVVGPCGLSYFLPHFGSIELVDARFHRSILVELHIDQSLGTHLRPFDEIGELVELFARIVGASRHTDAPDIFRLVEDGEGAGALELGHEFDELHTEAKVGFVGAVSAHGLMPRHLLEFFGQLHIEHLLEKMACHILEEHDDILLVDERHLAVDLCELRLSVGPEVFVAEALGDLEITVEATDHEQLLQRLRALRQGVELSRVHARGHYEVASPLGCRPDEYGCFHFDEVACVEEVAYEDGHAMPEFQVFPHGVSPEVEVPVFHAYVVATIGIVFDGEGRSGALAEHIEFADDDLDIARGYVFVFALPFAHLSDSLDAVFTSELVGAFAQFSIDSLVEHQLRDTIPVTQVDESHSTHLPGALYPSGECHHLAHIREPQFSTRFCPVH